LYANNFLEKRIEIFKKYIDTAAYGNENTFLLHIHYLYILQMKTEDIKDRQEYLKARRDKLVALKKEARSEQLKMNKTRPSSARILAEATMKGQELETAQAIDPLILQVRRALAARLKAEVVHK